MTEYHHPVASDDEVSNDADESTRRKGDSGLGRPSGPKQSFVTGCSQHGVPERDSAENSGCSTRRKGDSGLGRPSGPKQSFPTDKLQEPSPPESELELDPPFDDSEKNLDGDVFWNWFGKLLRGLILPVAAIAGFFVVTQTASFLISIRQLSIAEQIGLSVGLAIFGGLIVWHLIKIFRLWWRLRVSPQVQTRALRELADRKALRELCMKKNSCAVDKLSGLLADERTYAGEEFKATLKRFAVSAGQITEFETRREQLLYDVQSKSSDEWLDDFKIKFQEPLDEIADRRIKKYYYHAGFMTALSPYPLMDRLIVLRACLAMLQELLEIYALKPSWGNRLILFAKVILNIYFAGVIDNAAEAGVNLVMDSIPELTNATLSKGLDMIIRKGGGKGAGMLVQAYMVYRLGDAAKKMLRPIRVS